MLVLNNHSIRSNTDEALDQTSWLPSRGRKTCSAVMSVLPDTLLAIVFHLTEVNGNDSYLIGTN